MSELNINRNTFLEKEELVNFQSFHLGNLWKQVLLNASYSFGMVTNNVNKFVPTGATIAPPLLGFNDPFKVEQGSVQNSVKVLPGTAITHLGDIISINVEDNIIIPNNGLYYWLKIAYITRQYELGTVSINTKGMVSGTVDFTGKIRGQSTSTPTCIKFEKTDGSIPLNNQIFQVVNVIDSNNIMITSSTPFVVEDNLRVVVLGTLPLGGVFSKEQRDGLYIYDYYTISQIQEISVSTPPEKGVDEYYIARVQNTNGTLVIDNSVKSEYWSLGNAWVKPANS